MKLLILSDLHFEFRSITDTEDFIQSLPESDVLILAGDITSWSSMPYDIEQFAKKYEHVLYVLGNHEYYNCYPAHVHEVVKTLPPNVHVLQNDIIKIGKHRFLGSTLWYPEPIHFVSGFNDHKLIKDYIPWVYEENGKAIRFFRNNLQEGDIMITHHLPSPKCTPKRFKNSLINCYFLCDIEDLIVSRKPAISIYGHTHDCMDFKLSDTRMICNPRGYPHENSLNYKPKVLEI